MIWRCIYYCGSSKPFDQQPEHEELARHAAVEAAYPRCEPWEQWRRCGSRKHASNPGCRPQAKGYSVIATRTSSGWTWQVMFRSWSKLYIEKLITETSGDIPDSAGKSQISPATQNPRSEGDEPQGSGSNAPDDTRWKREEARCRKEEAQRIWEEQQQQEAAKLGAARARKGKGHESTDAEKWAKLKKGIQTSKMRALKAKRGEGDGRARARAKVQWWGQN